MPNERAVRVKLVDGRAEVLDQVMVSRDTLVGRPSTTAQLTVKRFILLDSVARVQTRQFDLGNTVCLVMLIGATFFTLVSAVFAGTYAD